MSEDELVKHLDKAREEINKAFKEARAKIEESRKRILKAIEPLK